MDKVYCKNAVEIFFEKIYEMNFDLRILSNLKVCAIGSATSNELKKRGIIADIVPKKFVAESLYEELMPILNNSDNILIPRAENARDYLVDKLKAICEVTEVHIYRTVIDEDKKDEILDILNSNNIDYITFTSSSTVNNLVEIIGKENIKILEKIKTLSIGPITTDTINSLGIKLYKESATSTIDSLVDLIIKN